MVGSPAGVHILAVKPFEVCLNIHPRGRLQNKQDGIIFKAGNTIELINQPHKMINEKITSKKTGPATMNHAACKCGSLSLLA